MVPFESFGTVSYSHFVWQLWPYL